MTWLGLVGGPLHHHLRDGRDVRRQKPGGTFQGLATIPEGLWELFLGVYCTIWGFKRDAPILQEAARLPRT